MRKKTSLWKILDLMNQINQIDFPEYQREPTIWRRAAKQRLVDSLVRNFDISAIYLYRHEDGHWDCVDGRQRISAIRSFFGNYIRECRNHRFSAAALKGTTCSSSECLDLARHFPLFTGFARTAIRPAYIGHRDVAFSLRGPAQPAAFGSSRTRLPRGPLAAGPCPSLPPGRSGCAPARRQHFPRQCATDQAPRQPLHLRFRVCVAHVVPPAKFPQVAP